MPDTVLFELIFHITRPGTKRYRGNQLDTVDGVQNTNFYEVEGQFRSNPATVEMDEIHYDEVKVISCINIS